jgi:hypothetical protein
MEVVMRKMMLLAVLVALALSIGGCSWHSSRGPWGLWDSDEFDLFGNAPAPLPTEHGYDEPLQLALGE